jgi:hypothetical protein
MTSGVRIEMVGSLRSVGGFHSLLLDSRVFSSAPGHSKR